MEELEMSKNYVSVTFMRDLEDDLDVIGGNHETPDIKSLKAQFLSEFEGFLPEARLSVVDLVLTSPEYTITANYRLDPGTNLAPTDALEKVREELQAAYSAEFAAGHFQIDSVVLSGEVYLVDELLEARKSSISLGTP